MILKWLVTRFVYWFIMDRVYCFVNFFLFSKCECEFFRQEFFSLSKGSVGLMSVNYDFIDGRLFGWDVDENGCE